MYETEQKMNMSIEMAICLRNNVPYDDMFKVANSFFDLKIYLSFFYNTFNNFIEGMR